MTDETSKAVDAERRAIVAWLRNKAGVHRYLSGLVSEEMAETITAYKRDATRLEEAATAIEHGAHRI